MVRQNLGEFRLYDDSVFQLRSVLLSFFTNFYFRMEQSPSGIKLPKAIYLLF